MHVTIAPLTAAQARELVCWQYEPPYEIYTIVPEGTPSAEIEGEAAYFLQPDVQAHGITAETGTLIAFCTFGQDARVPGGDYSADALDIGLGVKPSWTGKGMGRDMVSAVVAFALTHSQPPALRVTIAEWNVRAQRVWQANGFEAGQRFVATGYTRKPFIIFNRKVPT